MTAHAAGSLRDRTEVAVWGGVARVVVTDPEALPAAEEILLQELAAFDGACSRFRADSEISRVHAAAGTAVGVGPVLGEAVAVAIRAAQLTNGVVDPTVGAAVGALGFDRDVAEIADSADRAAPGCPAPGWWRLGWDAERAELTIPRGVTVDLGATAKALAADRAAVAAAEAAGCGVLVGIGGDIRAAGPVPDRGWRIGIGDDHVRAADEPDVTVTITGGGLATSGIGRRSRLMGGRRVHHIVDPRSGDVPPPRWRTVTVTAASCVDANTASTASIVFGDFAPVWLEQCRLPARLVDVAGAVVTTCGWPRPEAGA